MTAKDVYDLGMKKLATFNVNQLLPALRMANEGAVNDVLNTNGCANYQWIVGVVDELKPKLVVELGGAMGVWDLCVLHALPQTSALYSITFAEHGLEFSYIADKYLNFFPVIGDDLDMNSWPATLALGEADIWYIDSLHEEKQLRAELDLYSPFFKKGAIVLLDDIHLNEGMERVWGDITSGKNGKWDCFDASDPLHWSGYGICIT